jgi:hypothetical protein
MSHFEAYSTPAGHLLFSKEYFNNVSIEGIAHAADSYPIIASLNSLRRWEWLDDEPASATAMVIRPSEVVPHPNDLLEITKGMQAAFNLGQRSVMVTFTFDGRESTNVYHFSKVSFCVAPKA